ncbi:MAG: hypothetical protein L6R28_21570 [Planctomycetes bacterium]|nr:hypothetical protein [Planctomycetota bacterium]
MNTSHSNRNAFVAAALFALAAAALSTCLPAQAAQDEGEGDDGGKREAGPPDGDPRGGVVVALKHEIGSPDIYKCTYSRSQEGADKYQEKGTFALKFETLGRTPEGYDLVTMVQQPLDIKRDEYHENSKKWIRDMVVPHTIETVILGPNYRMVTNRRCYVFTSQNFIAQMKGEDIVTKTDGNIVRGTITAQDEHTLTIESLAEKVVLPRARVQKIESTPSPHVLRKETPHYLFPVFSRHPVTPGQAWQYRVPVIIPMSAPSTGRLLPSHFEVLAKAQLREVRDRVAFVDYTYEGTFDSAAEEFRNRFAPEIHAAVRVVHRIVGKGWVSVDTENSRIVQKSENMTLTMDQKADKQVNTITITAGFQMNWVAPDKVKELGAPSEKKEKDR